jgi:serine phosphatase RsbU (regulator of sigma subunit)
MANLVILQGPDAGRQFALGPGRSVIGRQPGSDVYLESLAVSRQHAYVSSEEGGWFIEDAGSSNGTFVNEGRFEGRMPLTEYDTIQIGPYVLALRPAPAPKPREDDGPIIRASVAALPSNQTLYAQNPALKLQVVLEIAQHLARTPEEALLGKLLDHLLSLFPQADRGLVLLCQDDQPDGLRLAECRVRNKDNSQAHKPPADFPYSRTLVRRALEAGEGILSEDIESDVELHVSTLLALKIRSLLCVPLVCKDGRRLGVLQLDNARRGAAFRAEDLELLTAIALQAAVVLDNAALHAERLRDERLRVEVAMARDIQTGYLPSEFPSGEAGFELFARVEPAHEVSGDLYDFFPLQDGRLAFCVGDVSGKGLPAALFMVAVHALFRHLAQTETGPAETLRRLDTALAADNSAGKFVTLACGVYDPPSGEMVLATAGHPPPLLRRPDGQVEPVAVSGGLPLGYGEVGAGLADTRRMLAPGETLILYTDGFTEGRDPGFRDLFGEARLREALGGPRTELPLAACADEARAAVQHFTGGSAPQDDLTLLLLRRT